MTKIHGFSKGTQQYLTFVGPGFRVVDGRAVRGTHPLVRSRSCTFLGIRFPKLVAADYRDLPRAAMSR